MQRVLVNVGQETSLAGQLAGLLDCSTTNYRPKEFSSGEYCPIMDDVNGAHVIIVAQDKHPQELEMRTLLAATCAKENDAAKVTLVSPLLAYARQDRGPKDDECMKGKPFSLKMAARLYQCAGIDEVITVHVHHSKRTKEIYQTLFGRENAFTHIKPLKALASCLQKYNGVYVVGPDKGAMAFVDSLAKELLENKQEVFTGYGEKHRRKENDPKAVSIQYTGTPLVPEATVVIADDIIDTAGTVCELIKTLRLEQPKLGPVIVYSTHAILGGEKQAPKVHARLLEAGIEHLIFADTIPHQLRALPPELKEKTRVIETAPLIAEYLRGL